MGDWSVGVNSNNLQSQILKKNHVMRIWMVGDNTFKKYRKDMIKMNITTFLTSYWAHTEKREANALREYFHPDVEIFLHDTNDRYDFESWINDVNGSEDSSGGEYHTTVDRIDKLENGQIVTITFHRSKDWIGFVTSFFTLKDDKIIELHEYYSPCDDFIVPQWRTDLAPHERIK